MIQLKGGFYLQLDLGGKKDFLSTEDLVEFTVVEHAGNALPEFILSFITKDDSLLTMFHEGAPIKATYGKSRDNLDEVLCYTGKISANKEGIDSWVFTLNGLCVNQSYVINHNLNAFPKKSGIETVISVLKKDFKKVETNITKSKDMQAWIQPSTTNKAFVSKTIMHSNLMPSFPVIAITASGTVILKDALKIVREEKPKFRLVQQGVDATDILVISDGLMEIDTTFINSWTGFGKVLKVLNTISGVVSEIRTIFKPVISQAKESEKLTGVNYRYRGFKTQSDNTHENYWKVEDHNLVHLTQMSKVEATHSFADVYHNIRPLDLVIYKDMAPNQKSTSEYTSGLYFVTGVSRTIQNKMLVTTVTLNRESVSALKNVSV